MSEITTLSTSTSWSASSDTTWIRVNPSQGTAGTNININVTPASSPDDESTGMVIIQTDTDTIKKVIKRCLPKVVSENKWIEFTVKYGSSILEDGSTFLVPPCQNGQAAGSDKSLTVSGFVLKGQQVLDNGSVINMPDTVLRSDEVNVWYQFNGGQSNYLTANTEKARTVTVLVELKADTSITGTRRFTQDGLKLTDGPFSDSNINSDEFVETGWTNNSITYEGFDISAACKEQHSPNCESGKTSFNFTHAGYRYQNYGTLTGLTKCGKTLNLYSKNSVKQSIPASAVTYSCTPVNEGEMKKDTSGKWYLHYKENESRTEDKTITVLAFLNKEDGSGQETKTTNFYVTKSGVNGGSCGNPIYIHASINREYINYTGDTAVISYFLSYSSEYRESDAIRDNDVLSTLSLSCPYGVTCGNETISNYVKKRNVTFLQNNNQNGEVGITWTFTATCESADNNPKTVSIYQSNKYENIIPNCDYFVFRYVWGDQDGKDLDSLTHITNTNLLDITGKNVALDTVGYGSTNGNELTKSGVVFLKHGGDNVCSGAEGAIVCLKNILKDEAISVEDEIHIDIYANWYGERLLGNMHIEYDQFSGTSENGTYAEEIEEIKHRDCVDAAGNVREYKTFSPKPGACYQIGETVSTPTINVKAAGYLNHVLAKNIDNCLTEAGAYSHVLRLSYNVASKLTSLGYFTDNGIDTKQLKIYGMFNGDRLTMPYHDRECPSGGKTYTLNNIYFIVDFNGLTNNYIFDDDGEYLRVGTKVGKNSSYTYSSNIYADSAGQTMSFGDDNFIENFKFTINADKTINITFKFKPYPTGEEVKERAIDIEFRFVERGVLNCNTTHVAYTDYYIYQNYDAG